MSGISQAKAIKFREAEQKRHVYQLRKVKSENSKILENVIKKSDRNVKNLREDFDSKENKLKIELERKLTELRNNNSERYNEEQSRLNEELKSLKLSHKDKMEELRESQQNEIESTVSSHKRTLKIAKEKFDKENQQYDT